MSASTATPASTAAASAVSAEGQNSRFNGKTRSFFGFDLTFIKKTQLKQPVAGEFPWRQTGNFRAPNRERIIGTGNLPGSGERAALFFGKIEIACANFAAELPVSSAF